MAILTWHTDEDGDQCLEVDGRHFGIIGTSATEGTLHAVWTWGLPWHMRPGEIEKAKAFLEQCARAAAADPLSVVLIPTTLNGDLLPIPPPY